MIDLEVAALACGITNVVTHYVLHCSEKLDYDGEELHAAAHGNGARPAPSDPSVSAHAQYTRWVMDRTKLADHYAPFLVRPDDPLPFLLT